MKISIDISKNILGFILTLYIASVIVFYQNFIGINYLLGAFLVVLFSFLTTLKKTPLLKYNSVVLLYAALTCLAMASSFWAVNFDLAFNKSFQMVYILINMFFLYNAIKIYHLEKQFLYGILIGAFANYIVLLGYINPPFPIYSMGRAMGTMGNANILAIFMNLSIFASILYFYLYKPKAIFLFFLSFNVFLATYVIFITASKKGLLLAGLLILIFLIMNVKSLKNIVFLSLLLLISIFIFKSTIDNGEFVDQLSLVTSRFDAFSNQIQGKSQGGSTSIRLHFMKLGLRLFSERSLVGFGIDNYRVFGSTYSHNNYIEILVGLGIVGFSLLLFLYYSVIIKIAKVKNKNIKYSLFTIMLGMIILEVAYVSYTVKITLFFIVFLSVIAENNQNTSRLNV